MGPNEDPEIRKMLRAEHLRLMRLPTAAKMVEEYQPAPDPIAEQMKQIELQRMMLENQLLEAQIKDEYSRAAENQVDVRKKTAEAILKEQQARLTSEKADMESLRFIKEDEQVDAMTKAEEKEKDRQHQLQLAMFQKQAGDKNIGIR